jgi:hypothetical protein
MAEAKQYSFGFKEITETLIKKQDIHEGLWGIYLKFGLGAANVADQSKEANLTPAAIVPVLEIGIQRFDEPNNLTVDAAQVNPAAKSAKARKAK